MTALTNGNYVVASPVWNNGLGAATWGSGTAGVNGVVSASNSLVGSGNTMAFLQLRRLVGGGGVTALDQRQLRRGSPAWSQGAVTWGSGIAGTSGIVSATNSLVGTTGNLPQMVYGDSVGGAVTALANGNYVVGSPSWNGNKGAATWGNGAAGVTGVVSAVNSLVGSMAPGTR